MRKALPFILICASLLTWVVSASAGDVPSPKEEVVYGLLNLDGSVNKLYVVNIFNGGSVTDFGDYRDIRNMTTAEKLRQNGDQITINTKADKFYYQGTLKNNALPWDISITYFLNGKPVLGRELAGKSGKLKIAVSVKRNDHVDKVFFDNYALQIALSLDNKLCTNIKADNATVAEAGSKKQLAYTVLPGTGIDAVATADVHDYEMDAITLSGIKLSLGINVDTHQFTGQISELVNAIKALDGGAGDLLGGLNRTSNGMQQYTDGMRSFKDGLGQLSSGASRLNAGSTALKNGLSELTKQSDSLVNGALAIQQATFDAVNTQLRGRLPVLTPENYSAILSPIPALAAAKKQLDGVVQFTQGLKGYTDGVAQLGKGASDLASGTKEFESSSVVIAASANELYNGGAELNTGIKRLRDGMASYKNGTEQLMNGTSGMSSEVNDKVDEMLNSISGKGDRVISFVSDKNTHVSAVQFVLKTDSIKIPDAQKATSQKPVRLSLWQKILKLFGL